MRKFTSGAASVAIGIASMVPMAWLAGTSGAAAGAWTGGAVTIRVELDLPSDSEGPLVQEVTDVPGTQVELTSDDVIDNPSNWCGTLQVDIDPDNGTVTVGTGQVPADGEDEVARPLALAAPVPPVDELSPGYKWDACNFETAKVTITGAHFETLTLVSDGLWATGDDETDLEGPLAAAPLPNQMNLDPAILVDGNAQLAWTTGAPGSDHWMIEGGAAVFAYTIAEPTTTTSTPTTIATTAPPTTSAPAAAQPAAAVDVTPTYTG